MVEGQWHIIVYGLGTAPHGDSTLTLFTKAEEGFCWASITTSMGGSHSGAVRA